MGRYTVEDYIKFIEFGRYDKISNNALTEIASAYRELEDKSDMAFVGPGYGDYTPELEDNEEVLLYMHCYGPSKLSCVKLLKSELGISLKESVDLINKLPSTLMRAKPKNSAGEKTTEYKHLLEVQLKFDAIQAGTSLK